MKFDRKLWLQINNTLRKREIDPSQIKWINCVKHHNVEAKSHFLAKASECYKLYQNEVPYLTEAWTNPNKTGRRRRYDILLLDGTNEIIEIETSRKNKLKKGVTTIFCDE
jgi:hypothetical protein